MVVDRPEGMKIVGESSPSQRLTTLAQPTPGLRLIMPNSIPRQPLHEWRELPSAWALLARSTAPPPANGLTPSQYQPFTGRAAPDAGFYLFFFSTSLHAPTRAQAPFMAEISCRFSPAPGSIYGVLIVLEAHLLRRRFARSRPVYISTSVPDSRVSR